MNKIITLSLILTIGIVSCQPSEKKMNKETSILEIAEQYYKALDNSDGPLMLTLLGDSIVIRENEDNYEERFSKQKYYEWLEWDGVFEPTYKILNIEQKGETVRAKISKTGKRIHFLHEQPMIWKEVIRFDNDKIVKVERIEYEIFDISKFVENRDKLVGWIDENHSELSGFLYPQIKLIGMQYLEAIALYQEQNN